ncbi:MAG TPA: ATP-binding cassette domain-containing protein, partial [Steroidobacteraceae bacterium]|nr:ATP-binding cassette domain-containing protein [Steroidobacteraceae bacterium]
MTLIALRDAELAFGLTPLLDRASLAIADGDRIGLIGRNGTGKSSLLGVLAGTLPLDDGEVQRKPGLRIALVEQEPVLPQAESVRESLLLRGGIARIADERDRHAAGTWLAEFLHRFAVNEDASPAAVSGGERKRAALALAFALEPEL